MDDLWTTHVLSGSQSSLLKWVLSPPNAITREATSSGEIFSVNGACEVYSISLANFTVSLLEPNFVRSQSEGRIRDPVLLQNDEYLVLLSMDDRTLYRFDLDRKEWSTTEFTWHFPTSLIWGSFTICSSKLYLFGGMDSFMVYSNDLWEFDMSSDQLEPASWKMVTLANGIAPPPRYGHSAISNGQTLLIYGGEGLSDTWEYNPEMNVWREVTTSPRPFNYPDHMHLVNDILFMLEGFGSHNPKLAAVNVANTSNQSDQGLRWLELGTYSDTLGDGGRDPRPIIVSDAFRVVAFLNASSPDELPIRICVLDTSHVMDPMTHQPLVSVASGSGVKPCTERVSLVRSSINAGRFESIAIADNSIGQGGFCDIFIGIHKPSRIKLALKRPRLSTLNAAETLRRVSREVEIWSAFDHVNILPFLGLMIINLDTYLVSLWMERGDLASFASNRIQYLKAEEEGIVPLENSKHDLYHLFDERETMKGIAAGIAYLHSLAVVHGDLKGKNVLLGEDNRPLLCDFGITKALDSPTANTSTAMKGVGTLRWKSPELFMGASKTFKSDIYAFAMIIVEILTGSCPLPAFDEVSFMTQILLLNARPPREPTTRNGISFAGLWDIAASCWTTKAEDRPSINKVLDQLEAMLISEN